MTTIIDKIKLTLSHPETKEALKSIKPQKSFWGIFSVIVLFIVPEIVAFIYGADITAYCQAQLQQNLTFEEKGYYQALEFLFGEGSWINLILGLVLLVWLFF